MNEKTREELQNYFNGLIVISGEVGVGKTNMGLSFPTNPEKTAFLNFDEKPVGVNEDFFLFYRNYFPILANMEGNTKAEDKMLAQFLEDLDMLTNKKEKPELVIIDSVERILAPFLSYTVRNISKLKNIQGGGKYAEQGKLGHAKVYSTAVFSDLRQKLGCPIILIAHLGDKYIEQVKVGIAPDINRVLEQKALLSVWLMHSKTSPVPDGLVLKRVDKKTITKEHGIQAVSVLPPKLSHFALPDYETREHVSVWDIIAHYWENPVGLRELDTYEQIDDEQYALISNSLTQTQKNILERKRQSGELSEMDEMVIAGIVQENINKPFPVIFARVKEAFEDQSVNISKSIVQEIVDRNK